MDTETYEKLTKAFEVGELKFFPVALSQDKKSGKVGSYVDARTVMDRLDSVVGPGNWSTSYRCIDPGDKAVECTLSIFIDGHWVAKSDTGYPNEAKDADNAAKEPWKAAYSDSLKRAAVQWGIGRYIYSLELERDWLPVDEYKKFTQQPRIRGATQQAEVPPRNAAASTAPSAPAASPPKKGFYEIAAEMGYTREQVDAESQRFFDNREPKQLTETERKRLLVQLEDAKKKEPVSA